MARRCERRLKSSENDLPHPSTGHLKGRSPAAQVTLLTFGERSAVHRVVELPVLRYPRGQLRARISCSVFPARSKIRFLTSKWGTRGVLFHHQHGRHVIRWTTDLSTKSIYPPPLIRRPSVVQIC